MTLNPAPTTLALSDVLEERQRQHAEHGTQTLSHGLRFSERHEMHGLLKRCRAAQEPRARRWADVLLEEVCEAVLATDAASRRAELVQVAAVACQQIEAIDREAATASAPPPSAYSAAWGARPIEYAPAWQRFWQRLDDDAPGYDANGSEVA